MTFEQIPGNFAVKARLKDNISTGIIPHAYIFCGQKGVFKHETALAFARLLTNGSEPDIIDVTNERYSIDKKGLSVDAIRAARQDIFTKPYMSDKKVFIINNAEDLNLECQNALLKVFEEPPEYCVIILVTNNESALLPTIRSRGVSVRFCPIENNEIKSYLDSKGLKYNDFIIKLANGSAGFAESLSSNEENLELIDSFLHIAGKLNKPSYGDIYRIIAFFEKEKDNYRILLGILSIMFRETLLKNVVKCDIMIFSDVSASTAAKMTEDIENAAIAIKSNGNYNTVISELFLKYMEYTD